MNPAITKYDWTNTLEAFCLSIAVDASPAAVEAAFRIVPATRQLTMINDRDYLAFAVPHSQGNDVVQINTLGAAIIAFENNGWTGTGDDNTVIADIGCPLFVSMFRNVNAVMQVTVAHDGVVIRRFDPLLYEADGALPEEQDLTWGVDHPTQSMFALAEMLSGIEITRDWLLGQPHPTYKTAFGN